jgi:hypothetical protein
MSRSLTISKSSEMTKHTISTVLYHLYTIVLFTYSDMKTIVIPQSAFGIIMAASRTISSETSFVYSAETSTIASRIPLVLLWVWLNLLPFAINNQRQPEAIAEDRLNKPWRPMPAGRWSPDQARHAMWAFFLVVGLTSWLLGGFRWSLIGMALGECACPP